MVKFKNSCSSILSKKYGKVFFENDCYGFKKEINVFYNFNLID